MREPTPLAKQLEWWRSALRGEKPPLHESSLHCGWFKARAWNRGPFLPGRIWIEQEIDFETGELTSDEKFAAEIGGETWVAQQAWTWLAGRPVTVAEYNYLRAMQPLLPPPPKETSYCLLKL